MMRGSGTGWWLLGPALMVLCMVMMARMIGGHGRSRRGTGDESDRILRDRLARGEIDVEDYKRLQQTLGSTRSSQETKEGSQ